MTETQADIQVTEFGYYLTSELISMPDRVLAQKIELAIWNRCPIPNEPILCKFIDLLKASEDESEFLPWAEDYVNSLPIIWIVTPNGDVSRVN